MYVGICNSKSAVPNCDVFENVGIGGNNEVDQNGWSADLKSASPVYIGNNDIFT